MPDDIRLSPRPFGNTGLLAAPLGLGGSYGISAEDTEYAFHELGINYFFVTPTMKGLAEGVRRLIKAGHRDKIIIGSGANLPFGATVPRAFAKSAKYFGVEQIDIFHLFWVQSHWYVEGNTWKAMAKLKEEGKIKGLAISCHDRVMARALTDELHLDALMIRYNAAHRGAEKEIFAGLSQNLSDSPAIVSYTATRWGRLLKPVKEFKAMSAPECYRFALSHPRVNVVLCGARNRDELLTNTKGVLEGPLPESRMAEVRQFGDAVRSTATGKIGYAGI